MTSCLIGDNILFENRASNIGYLATQVSSLRHCIYIIFIISGYDKNQNVSVTFTISLIAESADYGPFAQSVAVYLSLKTR